MKTEKDIYLVVTITKTPAKGEKTFVKDWAKTGKWEVFEIPEITDSLQRRHMENASVIINVTSNKIVKNNTPGDNDSLYAVLVERYSKNIAQFIAMYYPEIVEEMSKLINDKDYEQKLVDII
jgi:hypothetical protein